MLQILKDIYSEVELSSLLGFKGGTSCLFFYNLPRYSVDLDFDLMDISKEKYIFQEVAKIIRKYGEVKDARIKRNTIFFLLSHGDASQSLKIEISTRGYTDNYAVLDYFGIPMKVMVKQDIFANKLVALLARNKLAMRDLFDLHFFFSDNWEINEEIVAERTHKLLPEYLLDCISYIEKIPANQVLHGLGELIDEKQKNWVKKSLKTDLIFLMNSYM